MTLKQTLDRYLPSLESCLQSMLQPIDSEFNSFYGMLQYHQGFADEKLRPVHADTGKRIRPMLCMLCCEAYGQEAATALPLAAAVELLHSFSIVHDDIQDRSPTRRHRPTVWWLWGEAQGIGVGDALYAAAHHSLYRLQRTVPADTTLKIAEALDETCLLLCEGQYMDMAFEREADVSQERYTKMIERKTAALIRYSAWSGGVVGGATEAQAKNLKQMGHEIGMAFQVQDDVLGIWGEEVETGKSASSDIATAKKTLPYLFALEDLPAAQAAELKEIYSLPERGQTEIAKARALIEAGGAKERCLAVVEQYHTKAVRKLAEAEPAPAVAETLHEFITLLSGRKK